MSSEQSEQQERHETSADAATLEDILERGIGQMKEQSKTNTTHLAAAAASARETQEMVRALAGRVDQIDELVRGQPAGEGPAARSSPGGDGEGAVTADDEAATTQEETMTPAASGPGDQGAGDGRTAEPAQASGTTEPQVEREPGAEDAEKGGDPGGAAPMDEASLAEEASQDETAPAGSGDAGSAAEDARTQTTPSAETAPAGADEKPAAPAAHPPPGPSKPDKKMFRLLAKIEKHLARAPQPSPRQTEILQTLAAIRTAQEGLHEALTAAIALTPAAPADDPGMPPAWQAFQEVMTRLDGLVRIIRPVVEKPVEPLPIACETAPALEAEAPALPAPDPAVEAAEIRNAVDQLLEAAAKPRRGFIRFAWISILVVTLSAGAAGGFLQREYTLLDLLDDTHGWKDRVWEHAGEEIARCIIAAADRGSRCAVTVEAGGAASASDP